MLFVILFCLSFPVISMANHEETELVRMLTNLTSYNKYVRPVLKESKPVVVRHGIILKEISDINEKQQKMIVNVLQKIEWKDEILNWNPADYGGIKEINIDSSHFWIPRLLLYNNADDKYPIERDDAKTRLLLRYNGSITWIVPAVLKSSCRINVKYFPLDEQFCSLRIGSWTLDIDRQDINPINTEIDLSMFSPNSQWELLETWAHRHTLRHSCCAKDVAQIQYDIHIKRLPLFYISNFILPCALIAALTAMVFLTPAETGEQLAVGVTILLSLVVFFLMVETRVPNTSDHLPLIAKYYCCTVIEISAVLAITCLIHKFEHHSAEPCPPWVQKYIIGYMGRMVFMTFEQKKKKKVQVISVSGGSKPVPDKVNLDTKVPKPQNSWMKKKGLGKLLQKNAEPSPFEGNKNVTIIADNMRDSTASEALEMQWKHAANILTRFMSLVYILAITITFFAIICSKDDQGHVFPKQK
ncbi:acetylcholine receptor subunit alpha-1-A-like [Dendronephthya gigantea]|uniref:acetylcholine receptor subunit alpha-1-A-like n=1 Tax=Dendronephthya gigantea TaxID=151771 RepID=UPI00106B01DF|nr:acetylcholine receptor subunit alpha-1-A-like [Dendronephthya gigantea]